MNEKEKTREELQQEVRRLRQRLADQQGAGARGLDEIFNRSLDLIVIAGMDGYYKRVNPTFTRLLGYTEQECLSHPFQEFIHPDDHANASRQMMRLLAGEEVINFEDRNLHKDGSVRWISWVVKPHVEEGLVYGVGRDITARKEAELQLQRAHEELEQRVLERTASLRQANRRLERENSERRQAEQALRKSEERFRLLAETMDDVVWTAVFEGDMAPERIQFQYVNPAIERLSGYPPEAYLEKPELWMNAIHPADREDVDSRLQQLKRHGHGEAEYRLVHRDGEMRWIQARTWLVARDSSGRAGMGGLVYDITEQRKTEQILRQKDEQLRQIQKLEAVGLLAGGVAHEYNNILQVIQGYTHLMLQKLTLEASAQDYLQRVIRAVDRATGLTEQLLSFSRRQPMTRRRQDLGRLLKEHLKMVKPLVGEQVEVEVRVDPPCGSVYIDGGQILQVLLNLCLNARDAMPGRGRLTYTISQIEVDPGHRLLDLGLSQGPYLSLAVEDTGSGISEEDQEKVFEPFFTTKEVGKGTGLGLAMAYGIIKQHDGVIELRSVPGEGTTVTFHLPIIEGHDEAKAGAPAADHGGGKEGILVAEDEPMILELALLILKKAGYRTFVATDGLQALRVFHEHLDEISLVLLDVVMPKLGGRAVLRQMKRIHPDLRSIFCSGYDPKNSEVSSLIREGMLLLRKPFTPNELLASVREVLDE